MSSLLQLKAGSDALLVTLARKNVSMLESLEALGASHNGDNGALRQSLVSNSRGYFPHPVDVPPLLLLATGHLNALFAQSRDLVDDLFVSAYGFYAVTAIHPFRNGNGRVALDFTRLLLMHRWNRRTPPLQLDVLAHNLLGRVFCPLDAHNTSDVPERFRSAALSLAQRLSSFTVASLRETPAFIVGSIFLARHRLVDAPELERFCR